MFNPFAEWWKNFTAPWFPCRVCGRQVREVYRAGIFQLEDSDGDHRCST